MPGCLDLAEHWRKRAKSLEINGLSVGRKLMGNLFCSDSALTELGTTFAVTSEVDAKDEHSES